MVGGGGFFLEFLISKVIEPEILSGIEKIVELIESY